MVNVDFDTSNTTFKSRYLAYVYGDICKPNDIKDSIMLNNITKIRFDSTSLNIREEVSSKISLYEKYDSELQDSQKQLKRKGSLPRSLPTFPKFQPLSWLYNFTTLQPLGSISR
ncbi:MAG: hypothetical protein ACK56F_32720, partial [bacterium]